MAKLSPSAFSVHGAKCFDIVPYRFGETRVAALALLTFTALPAWRSCGVTIAKFSGHAVAFRSSPNGHCGHSDVRVRLHPHLTWQATKSYVKRGNAFGFISHKGSLTICSGLFWIAFCAARAGRPG